VLRSAFAIAVLGLAAAAPAQDSRFTEPIVTDRPDFTESAQTVPHGAFQLEAGYTFVSRSGPDEHTFGEVLLRYGISPDLELRLEAPSLVMLSGNTDDEDSGLSDMSLGLKHRLAEQDGWRPALAVIAALVLPTGTNGFSESTFIPEATLAWSYDLQEPFTLSGNFNLSVPEDDDDDRFLEPSASIALGIGLTDNVGAFIEYFGFYPDLSTDRPNTHYADGGLTYLINPNLQLDARIGAGLNSDADDLFAGVGFAVRW
jgi:hypothetical protein